MRGLQGTLLPRAPYSHIEYDLPSTSPKSIVFDYLWGWVCIVQEESRGIGQDRCRCCLGTRREREGGTGTQGFDTHLASYQEAENQGGGT